MVITVHRQSFHFCLKTLNQSATILIIGNNFDNLSVEKPISKIPESASEKENLFLVGRGIESSYYKVKNLEERLSKYHIKAPFDGILVKGNISDGAFIVPNQILGEFIDPNNFEVGVNIPVNFLEKINSFMSVM